MYIEVYVLNDETPNDATPNDATPNDATLSATFFLLKFFWSIIVSASFIIKNIFMMVSILSVSFYCICIF
jgi:hypothetical protein